MAEMQVQEISDDTRSGEWMNSRITLSLLLLVAAGIGAIAVSSQSLWIDEGMTALKAVQPTVRHWWNALSAEHNSNLQLPFYMLFVWAWEKAAGASEYALRAGNLPWFCVTAWAFSWGFRRQPEATLWCLGALLTHPFIWYYLNEARPYIMQIAGASGIAACFVQFAREDLKRCDQTWWWVLAASLVLTCGTGMLGVPWAGCALLALMLWDWTQFRRSFLERGVLPAICASLCLAGLAVYYAWTLREGARATLAGTTTWQNVAFVTYEHLGLAGLGPGRNEIREGGADAFLPFLPALGAGGLLAGGVISAGLSTAWRSLTRRQGLLLAMMVVVPLGFVFAVGVLTHFRVLGRHVAPLSPLIVLIAGQGLQRLWERHGRLGRALAAAALMLALCSCLQLRFSFRHSKDDYRAAARQAHEAAASGKVVWWAADAATAAYYGLRFDGAQQLFHAEAKSEAVLRSAFPPDVLILSKRDLFDPHGGIQTIAEERGLRLTRRYQAFEIWE